jgi:hypothetical protein
MRPCYVAPFSHENLLKRIHTMMSENAKTDLPYDEFAAAVSRDEIPTFQRFLARMPSVMSYISKNSAPGAIDTQYGVVCFCEDALNPLMWAHYTCGYRGFVVGFDGSHELFAKDLERGDLRSVRYVEDRPTPNLDEATNEEIFFTKSRLWEYEREWRLLRQLSDAERVGQDGEYPVYVLKLPPRAISEIIIGFQTPPDVRTQIQAILSDRSELSHVLLYGLVLDERRYILHKERLPPN